MLEAVAAGNERLLLLRSPFGRCVLLLADALNKLLLSVSMVLGSGKGELNSGSRLEMRKTASEKLPAGLREVAKMCSGSRWR